MNSNFSSYPNENDPSMSSDEEVDTATELIAEKFQENQNDIMEIISHIQCSNTSHGGSVKGHNVVYRDREGSNFGMYKDYFSPNPVHDDDKFQRRYRMRRELFLRICSAVKHHDSYFEQRRDAVGRLGFSTHQKVTAAMRILALGIPADAIDEYITVAESTAIESFKRFCRAIIEIFSTEYLRAPNASDIARLLHISKSRGFPGMLESLDCMHWEWKACPTAWQGQFSGRSGTPSIILEAVADYDLWI